jgi:hypothetical protein
MNAAEQSAADGTMNGRVRSELEQALAVVDSDQPAEV